MKTIILSINLFLLVSLGFLASCKKGDKDPFLSLRTRKSRFVGDWKVVKKTSDQLTKNQINTTLEYSMGESVGEYNGQINTISQTDYTDSLGIKIGITSYTITQTYMESYSFKKDGTFSYTINYSDTLIFEETGIWEFLPKNKTEKLKNKEAVQLYTIDITQTYKGSVPTLLKNEWNNNAYVNFKIFELEKLTKKEIIISYKRNTNTTLYSNSGESDLNATYYLEPK